MKDRGRIEVLENGIVVISNSGNQVYFDENFEKIREIKAPKVPEFFKKFYYIDEKMRVFVREWYKIQKAESLAQRNFLDIVGEAIEQVNYNYAIATIEPSLDESGSISYQANREVFTEYNCYQWDAYTRLFALDYGSRLGTVNELFIWYALRIAAEAWTIDEVCDKPISNMRVEAEEINKAGTIKYGEFFDGVTNTAKIVFDSQGNFILCGGSAFDESTYKHSIAHVCTDCDPMKVNKYASGVMVCPI